MSHRSSCYLEECKEAEIYNTSCKKFEFVLTLADVSVTALAKSLIIAADFCICVAVMAAKLVVRNSRFPIAIGPCITTACGPCIFRETTSIIRRISLLLL